MAKKIFITGASRGLGRIWAAAFLKRGDQVIVAVRNPDALNELSEQFPANLLVIKVDVTNKTACFEAIALATSRFGVIDVLINNAGYGHTGAIEELTEEEVRRQFETNVYGSLWMMQAVLPVMREQHSGHIIQVSSALGIVSFPTLGLYSASKFAVEALSDSLAAEVSGFGIKVSVIEPNGYRTDFATTSGMESKALPVYDGVRAYLAAGNNIEDWGIPEATVPAVLQLVDAENPPLRLILGRVGFQWIKSVYQQRMQTWEEWQDVSIAAQGN